MGSKTLPLATIEFLKKKVVQWSTTGDGKTVTLGKMLSLATPRGAIMGKIWLLWVFRSLENAFATIADLKMLSDTDGHTKPQLQSQCTFMQISLYIILLPRKSKHKKSNSLITITLRIVSKFPTIIVVISYLK